MPSVRIPSPLRSYTRDAARVAGHGEDVAAVLANLEARFTGIRFRIVDEQERIRPHIRIFINRDEVRHLTAPVREQDEVHLICALSGG